MLSTTRYFISAVLVMGLMIGCGSEEQDDQQTRQQKEQAKQDSIARAKADSIARAKADSAAKAKQQKQQQKEQQEQEEKLTLDNINFNSSGAFSVQVEAWRSQDKAQQQVSKWKERGFSNAYVVKVGNEDTGNIWFRVRLGRISDKPSAERLSKLVKQKYNEKSWISETGSGI
mgnify:CR=1 FL=1